ncbi:hypothetical protein AB0I84_13770 [Streptomyces spectabilis]|uniref:ATP-binding protein n=1 Tax=Streptomyces spectabilis TaxID=68270 RepID=A0A5P2XDK7_STRST|nr:hypothetical protein [Streptomyces spectabilis]MBB5107598.1 hypothetical protein [Streptomyces spectabilis]MCI3904736.1 hypothetical protein [Streptomyces spectabilis]QEV61804.1 hypothetical protein CP982_26380 [Streptomyces spectabilis]GGV02946.1 hypothetical protein GCM10010245_07750 [Streptomyces spectabilis]
MSSSAPVRALLRAGLTVSAAGAALGVGAGGASGAELAPPPVASQAGGLGNLDVQAATAALGPALAPAKRLKLDPLAGTGVDPLDNAVGTQVADFQPVSTGMATGPLTQGGALGDLPVTGAVSGLLPG